MNIEELYKEYADRQVSRVYPDLDGTNLCRASKMGINVFNGGDIELAVEYGAMYVLNQVDECFDPSDDIVKQWSKIAIKLKELRGE